MDEQWTKLPNDSAIKKTVENLKQHNIDTFVVENGKTAKEKVFSLIPKGAEVMNMTSVTLDTIGVSKEILESGNYNPVREKLMAMDRKTQGSQMQKLGAAPDWSIGSVHAVTEDGVVLVASNSGSQIPGYVYGSNHVIWVVSTQKIVKNLDEGMKRIYEHCLPLESERAHKAYGVPASFVSRILVTYRDPKPGRTTLIFVKEKLGF